MWGGILKLTLDSQGKMPSSVTDVGEKEAVSTPRDCLWAFSVVYSNREGFDLSPSFRVRGHLAMLCLS